MPEANKYTMLLNEKGPLDIVATPNEDAETTIHPVEKQ
jgi:hypothetical protein